MDRNEAARQHPIYVECRIGLAERFLELLAQDPTPGEIAEAQQVFANADLISPESVAEAYVDAFAIAKQFRGRGSM